MDNKFYLTTAIAYTSRKPHIGNTYEIVLADCIARFKRLQGYDVFFLTGTDEHGQKIEEIAKSENSSPKDYVDKIADQIKTIWNAVGSSHNKFIRTTDKYHKEIVQKIFKKLYDKGDIYKGEYSGLYCTPCESFWTESQVENNKCPDCDREVIQSKEEAYFFKMSNYENKLIDYINDNPDFIQPESRKNEMINTFLKSGLQDLCVSRTSFKWGIPITFDDKHVVYVWIDALSNYITALGYDPDKVEQCDTFSKYWPADVHIIGKDILRFHTIYWPIILMALDLPLPKKVLGHPWLLSGSDKMSKSKGNVIYADDLINHFGLDALRYYLLSEMPYAQDGHITYENIILKYNADLANNIGNLVNRTVTMIDKYFDKIIPEPDIIDPIDSNLIKDFNILVSRYKECMEQYKISNAVDCIISLASKSNKYIDETMPWTLNTDQAGVTRLRTVLYNLIESIRIISIMLSPIIPDTSEKIFSQINCSIKNYESIFKFGSTISNVEIGEYSPLFARIDLDKKLKEIQKIQDDKKNECEYIGIEDFSKVNLKAAKIISCEKIKKSKKLLKLIVNDGSSDSRQIVSGISEYYNPNDLVGKMVVIVSNLKPVKLLGNESFGMVLASEDKSGKINVLFLDENIEPGAVIR